MHIATCFPVSSTDKAAISTIAPRTHIDRRDVESGKCNASSRLSKHRTSSLRTRSSTATSTHADTKWLPETTEPYGRRHSMRGGRTHAPGARHDYASRRTTGSALPSQVNVTMPQERFAAIGAALASIVAPAKRPACQVELPADASDLRPVCAACFPTEGTG